MFHKSIAVVAALISVSAAVAATVTIIPASNLPVDAPTVNFNGLPITGNGITSYTEADLTLTAAMIWGAPGYGTNTTTYAGIYSNWFPTGATQRPLLSFAQPVNQISLTERGVPMFSLTLFADAAGTESLGTFDVSHSWTPTGLFAFQSDTPFRSFTYTAQNVGYPASASYHIDDLRYANAVPEPSALLAGLGAVTGYFGLQRRRRA